MTVKRYSKTGDFFLVLSPWILAAACLLLLSVLTLFTVNNYQREKKLVVDALTQKGVTIIGFINSSSRESMRANFHVSQDVLPWEEHARIIMGQAAELPGVNYVALVDINNRVIVEAGAGLTDKSISAADASFFAPLRDGRPGSVALRDVRDREDGKRYLQVAGPFQAFGGSRPLGNMRGRGAGNSRMMMSGAARQQMFTYYKGESERIAQMQPILIVQLDFDQFSSPVRMQIVQIIILFAVFILVAVGSFLSLLTLRGLKGSRLRLGRIEKELQRSERLAALGKMAAGVAHELRNPLSSIKGLAILLKSKCGGEKDGIEAATVLVQEVERLNRSIGELLDYAKPSQLNKIRVRINVIIEETALLIDMDRASRNIALDLRLADTLPEIEADEDKLKQVFLNLFLNGIQAMDEGGTLTVNAYLEGRNVLVTVEDTGAGVAAENLQKVFDPYFTTKSDGTGLGLAVSAKIIEEHGGEINISSRPGEGTRVEVVLPR